MTFSPARASWASPLLVDAAQSAGHRPLDVQQTGCDFLVFSGHKMCGPTGIGVLYGRKEVLEDMPPYQGGGEMILNVTFQKKHLETCAAPFRGRNAGYFRRHWLARRHGLSGPDWPRPNRRARSGTRRVRLCEVSHLKTGIRLFGPHIGRAGLVSFLLKDVHAHDVVTVADQRGVALRGGHHCNQPLMHRLGVESRRARVFIFTIRPRRSIGSPRYWAKFKSSLKLTKMTAATQSIGPESTMREVLEIYRVRNGRSSGNIISAGAVIAVFSRMNFGTGLPPKCGPGSAGSFAAN